MNSRPYVLSSRRARETLNSSPRRLSPHGGKPGSKCLISLDSGMRRNDAVGFKQRFPRRILVPRQGKDAVSPTGSMTGPTQRNHLHTPQPERVEVVHPAIRGSQFASMSCMEKRGTDSLQKVSAILDTLKVHRAKAVIARLQAHKANIEVFYLPPLFAGDQSGRIAEPGLHDGASDFQPGQEQEHTVAAGPKLPVAIA